MLFESIRSRVRVPAPARRLLSGLAVSCLLAFVLISTLGASSCRKNCGSATSSFSECAACLNAGGGCPFGNHNFYQNKTCTC